MNFTFFSDFRIYEVCVCVCAACVVECEHGCALAPQPSLVMSYSLLSLTFYKPQDVCVCACMCVRATMCVCARDCACVRFSLGVCMSVFASVCLDEAHRLCV